MSEKTFFCIRSSVLSQAKKELEAVRIKRGFILWSRRAFRFVRALRDSTINSVALIDPICAISSPMIDATSSNELGVQSVFFPDQLFYELCRYIVDALSYEDDVQAMSFYQIIYSAKQFTLFDGASFEIVDNDEALFGEQERKDKLRRCRIANAKFL